LIAQADWQGRILTAPTGNGGFGYDPIFWVPETECSAAELSSEQKHAISHRGKALKHFMNAFQSEVK
jgi:XTP/dITP diphosphohydrolase